MAANATTSPLASIKYGAANVAPQLEYVIDYVSNASAWTILATVLAMLVVYDQCMSRMLLCDVLGFYCDLPLTSCRPVQ